MLRVLRIIILLFGAAMESKFVARRWKYNTAK